MIKFCCRLTIHTLICALLHKRILARTSGIFGDLMSAERKTDKNTNTADNTPDEQPGDCAKHKTEALKTDSECAATNPSEAESANNENASKKAEAKNADSECAAAQIAVAEPLNDTRHDTDTSINLKYDGMRQVAKGGALGAFIGLAVIVPGVSGSVAAIILGLYEKLLYAIGHIFSDFKRCILFLLPIAAGAAVGLIVGFFGVKLLLEVMMFAVVALFAGLMLGALPSVTDEIKHKKHTPLCTALVILGAAIPIALSLAAVFAGGKVNLEQPAAYEYIIYLLIGFAVAATQLIPGLSATALLMTTGHYVPLVQSVSIAYWQQNPEIFAVYACLIAGFVAGILCFAKLLELILKKLHTEAMHLVTGLAFGSVITMFFNPEMYEVYRSWAAGERFGPDLLISVVLFVVGFIAAFAFVKYRRKHGRY